MAGPTINILNFREGLKMAIHKSIRRCCPKCNKEVDFQIVMRYVDYNGIIPCLRCPSCNTECPAYSFEQFISTGRVIIGV